MRAGDLTERLWIDVFQSTRDEVGQEIADWSPLAQVWAKVDPLRGQEQALAAGADAPYDSRITIRWSPYIDAITAKWRLRRVQRGTTIIFDITSVPPVPDREGMLVLTARSGLTEG